MYSFVWKTLPTWLTKIPNYVSTYIRHRQWVIITATRFPARRHPLLTTSDYNSFILFRFLGFIEKPIESSVMFSYVYSKTNQLKHHLRKIVGERKHFFLGAFFNLRDKNLKKISARKCTAWIANSRGMKCKELKFILHHQKVTIPIRTAWSAKKNWFPSIKIGV